MYLQRAAIKRIAGYLGNRGLFRPAGIFGYLEWDELHDIGIGESSDSAVFFSSKYSCQCSWEKMLAD